MVVIPDCFNLDIPLTSHSAPQSMTQSYDDFQLAADTSHDPAPTTTDDVMMRSCDSVLPNEQPTPVPIPHVEPGQKTPPTASNEPKTTGASPQTDRRQFVPPRVTLRGVKDARLRNPLTMATGFVNTVTDLVEGLTLSGKKRDGGGRPETRPPPAAEEDEGETFVVSGSGWVAGNVSHTNV